MFIDNTELEPEDKVEKYINDLLGVRDDVYQHANHNIKVAQEKQKKDYDRRNCVTQHNFIDFIFGFQLGIKISTSY
jgi:acid phosphatase family membrane protein YuiD